ncbi:group III truncated hemoglobin [Tabrizicola sp. J26]|uniref:group III truncated hemoglobin n=1 Tax=Alitabrizicola rongguiensis TaxID=2909234 RepID=UPI001F42D517|nr:group III truncated hemoglobin [Tabrizicola rongguiensis]MCF1709342.1 group III truncated hemoglobin [Tabrizicola rongguiensis]
MQKRGTTERADAIDRPLIGLVVRTFYDLVRRDPVLGPIFNPRIEDWVEHEAKLTRFWSSVLLMTGEYHGTPMRVHLQLPDLEAGHFDRWLSLFAKAQAAVCTPDQAAAFQSKAERIAESFRYARDAQRSNDVPRLAS